MDRPLAGARLDQPQHGLACRALIAIDLIAGRRPLDFDRHSLEIARNAARRRAQPCAMLPSHLRSRQHNPSIVRAQLGRASSVDPSIRRGRRDTVVCHVMHEFKHGELKSGRGGKGGKVRSRQQAIAIALEESGASKYESGRRNRRNLRRTETKETRGRTAQQEREGRSHVGAASERESTRAMGGRNSRKPTTRGRKAALARARKHDGHTRQELYAKARRRHIEGRSRMTKRQLENALGLR